MQCDECLEGWRVGRRRGSKGGIHNYPFFCTAIDCEYEVLVVVIRFGEGGRGGNLRVIRREESPARLYISL